METSRYINGQLIQTNKEYMAGPLTQETHNAFYAQFVTANLRNYVSRIIGKERIINSADPHFNDIPLKQWDAMDARHYMNMQAWKIANAYNDRSGYWWSMSNNVCVLKAAALQIKQLAQR
jgi:hypothetical protein